MTAFAYMIPLFLLLQGPSQAAAPDTATAKRFVPSGWRLHSLHAGDLDRDGRPDLVVVVEENDPAKHRPNDFLGEPDLNLNPRRLIIALQGPQGYRAVQKVDGFLPSENEADTPCLLDPLAGGGLSIAKGVLVVEMNYFLSCGSYWTTRETYRFRHENGRFRLIGFDEWSFSRATHEETSESTNFLTGRRKVVTDRTEWQTLPKVRAYYLDDLAGFRDSWR